MRGSLVTKVSGRVRELVLSHVHQECKVPEEVCSDDRLLDVCNKEYPLEIVTKTKVEH